MMNVVRAYVVVCCFVMASAVVANEKELKKAAASKLVASEENPEVHDLDLQTIESDATFWLLNRVFWSGGTQALRIKNSENIIEADLVYRVGSMKSCNFDGPGDYRFEPLKYHARSYSDKTVYVKTEKNGDKIDIRFGIGKEPVCSCVSAQKKKSNNDGCIIN